LTDAAKALVAAHAARWIGRPVIWLVDSDQRAEQLAEPLSYFHRALGGREREKVVVLPAHDVTPWQERSPHPEISEARAAALWRIATGQAAIVLASVASALLRISAPEFYSGLARTLSRDQDVSVEELLAFLDSSGYERAETVETPGQFALRGGIVDVFSPETPRPVRIELLSDTIESLREFDPATQRSTQPVERTTLLSLVELPRRADLIERVYQLAGRETVEERGLASWFPGWEFAAMRIEPAKNSLFDLSPAPTLILDEPSTLHDASSTFLARLAESFKNSSTAARGDRGEPEVFYLRSEEFDSHLAAQPQVTFEHLALDAVSDPPAAIISTQPTVRYHGNIAAFLAEARGRVQARESVIVSCTTRGEVERLADLCREYELPFRLGDLADDATGRLAEESAAGALPSVTLIRAPITDGVSFPEVPLTIYGHGDLFETVPAPERARSRPKLAAFSSDFSDLKSGDYVVHVDHGIGRFEGLRQVDSEGASSEFMLIAYADDARLYVPLARMDLVQKYNSLGGTAPALDKLGGTAWVARKKKVRRGVAEIADRLLKLYAERKTVGGFAYSADSTWQREFEDAFEFEETPDQLRAIQEVKRDMEAAHPMDRLLCGDVGYGKTEVAMRAAFKAVCDSRQVAVLAPTTVLAFQHWQTFRRRFAAFPMHIEMLSRFRTGREQKEVLGDVETGKVDILIGTHRLLSKDVKFYDLGLLVTDEEQRFGVAHKERIKELRKDVDVLTLSATPIPRTLHMSLAGLRDMSLIETPPKDRLSIQTVVAPFSEALAQRAMEEELARGGQTYFVHNRVDSIYSLAAMIQKLVPHARVVVGHGQMGESELEKAMMKFVRHEADILVSTTIIENGLDIPRCNTMIVNRADRMGLAELYQLRGRVGRSNQRAYAYLLVPPDVALSGLARERLAALRQFSELGAGFRIAALDLEMRGAGNLLGREQHGHIGAVGFDLYCQMLERAVSEKKGEALRPEQRATFNLGLDIRIPADYIPSETLRLRTYKRIAAVVTEADKEEMLRELTDRFGEPPAPVRNLLEYAVLKALSEQIAVASVERRAEQVALRFHDSTPLAPERLVQVVRRRKDLRLDPGGLLWLEWPRGSADPLAAVKSVLQQLQA
jgi:transcription-repair coupling factor (superfamily II helicase)